MDDALNEALARRGMNQPGVAALQQVTPAAPVQGGAPAPIAQGGQAPAPSTMPVMGQKLKAGAAGAGQVSQSPLFNDRTRLLGRELAKSIIDDTGADDAARSQLVKRLADVI